MDAMLLRPCRHLWSGWGSTRREAGPHHVEYFLLTRFCYLCGAEEESNASG